MLVDPRSPLTRLLVPGLLTLIAAGLVLFRMTAPPSPRQQLEAVRGELRDLRLQVDSCQSGLAQQEVQFRSFDGEVTELQARIRAFESLHPAGVPGDSYVVYLETVNQFNLAVPRWSDEADLLKESWAACRTRIEAHNAMADSLFRMVEAQGLIVPTRVEPTPLQLLEPEWEDEAIPVGIPPRTPS
jgi:hypothetical protein